MKCKSGVGATVMLRRNINVAIKLANGKIGRVTKFLTDDLTNQIIHVVVKFSGLLEEVAIRNRLCTWGWEFTTGIIAHRPTHGLAYGRTIHKSQSQTVSNLMLNANDGVFQPGMVYVGCSRERKLQKFVFY
jgi:ATP-dependent exoDNAse (exonuclease V) alpha subunit